VTDDVHGSMGKILVDAPEIFYTPRNGGHWIVRRLEPIGEILRDYEHFSAREMLIPRIDDHPVFLPLSLDPPQSTPYRLALMPAFSVRSVRELEPKMREWAATIVQTATVGAGCDFVRDVATVYPVSIFMEMMGMPLTRLREFRALSNAFFDSREPAEHQRLSSEILAILAALVDERREVPGEDLVSVLLITEVEGRRPSTDEVLAMCFLLFLGGMDTVTNLTGFAFRLLASDRALQERLSTDPDLIPKFVDEALRSFPVINPSRLVIKDCDRFGVPMRSGDMVLCLPAEGARDARANPEPDRFHIDREHPRHLSFGTGPHLCIGHILARTEIRILTEEWLRCVPRFEAQSDQLNGFRIGAVMALESLLLRWDAT
jgi:cytochrome P450